MTENPKPAGAGTTIAATDAAGLTYTIVVLREDQFDRIREIVREEIHKHEDSS